MIDRRGGLIDSRRLIDNRSRLDHRRRLLHHDRFGRDDVMHQIHDSCGEAEAIAVVMMMRWWRWGAMRMVRGSGAGPMHLMHRGAAAASMSAVSSAIVSGRG